MKDVGLHQYRSLEAYTRTGGPPTKAFHEESSLGSDQIMHLQEFRTTGCSKHSGKNKLAKLA